MVVAFCSPAAPGGSSQGGLLCETRLRAMGSDVHIMAIGARRSDLDQAKERLHDLELLWSRFIDDSEMSRLNRSVGPMAVSVETFRLVELAIIGWERTAGRFDPTVHDAVVEAGYDQWSESTQDHSARSTVQAAFGRLASHGSAVPGCAGIRLDHEARTIELPQGVRIDPGGIGKGLAADLVSAELIAAGAQGALVNLGGDLRVRGVSPDPSGWLIDVREPTVAEATISRLCIVEGAVATSTTEKRCWDANGTAHHLIDPSSGRPHDRSIRLATVVTRDAWWAEVSTKQLIGNPAHGHVDITDHIDMPDHIDNVLVDAAGLVITADGEIHRSTAFEGFER